MRAGKNHLCLCPWAPPAPLSWRKLQEYQGSENGQLVLLLLTGAHHHGPYWAEMGTVSSFRWKIWDKAEKASGQKKAVSKAFSDMPQSALCISGILPPFSISPFSPQPLGPKTGLFLLFFLKQKFYPLHLSFTFSWLYDIAKITQPNCTSVSSSIK